MCVRTLIVSALMMPSENSSQIPFPGISSCHFRLLVPVHPMGNILYWGEALPKHPERPCHPEWYRGSIMLLSLAATLGLVRPLITLHNASCSFG